MHAGGQPPIVWPSDFSHIHYLNEAGIPYSRLHDVGGMFGGGKYVDVPNIFRDFDADETDPANYDFDMTDLLLAELEKVNVEPYYRLGITIENFANIKPYHAFPPKNYEKWARICEYIIRHYTEGWGNGYHYKITYWEIWNEPDMGWSMWNGTPEEFYRLYDVTAKHLKQCFPHLKIGGYSSVGFYAKVPDIRFDPKSNSMIQAPVGDWQKPMIPFFYGFIEYIKEHGSPIDFFSWHCYDKTWRVAAIDEWLHNELQTLGFPDLETHLTEWNPCETEFGTGHHSAEIAATMLALQNGHTDICFIYEMQLNYSPYCPLFDIRSYKPIHGYYALVAFNALYRLGTQVKCGTDNKELYAVAASNGERHALMISNLTGCTQKLEIEGVDLSNAYWHVIDQERMLSWTPAVGEIENNTVLLIEF